MMAIRIEPKDTLVNPKLDLDSENNFYKVSFSNVPIIQTDYYKINFKIDNLSTQLRNQITTESDKIFPISYSANGVYVTYEKLASAPDTAFYQTSLSIGSIASIEWPSNIFSSANSSIYLSYYRLYYSSVQYSSQTYNDKSYDFEHKFLYADFDIILHCNDAEQIAKVYNASITLTVSPINSIIAKSDSTSANIRNASDSQTQFATGLIGNNSIARSYTTNGILSIKDQTITFSFRNVSLALEATDFLDIGKAYKRKDFFWGFVQNANYISASISLTDTSKVNVSNPIEKVNPQKTTGFTYTFDENYFINNETTYSSDYFYNYISQQLFSRYYNGKHTGSITIKIGKYYDDSFSTTEPYIDPTYEYHRKFIKVGDIIEPYIYDKNNNLIPLLSDGAKAVDFVVMESELRFDNGMISDVLKIMEE
jgi:hypothetical protein